MKIRTAYLLLSAAFLALAFLGSGCASTESDNSSARPWNSPQGWESSGALGGMDYQHQ